MYESPITQILGEMRTEYENGCLRAVQSCGFDVNKEELAKALAYDRGQYEKGYEDGLNADKWILCSERLPEQSGKYIVTVKNLTGYWILENNVFVCDYQYDEFIFQGWEDNKVIAWQPLPTPYQPD